MANNCYADMLIGGYKDNVDTFIKYMQTRYDYNNMIFDKNSKHFFRIFEVRTDWEDYYGVRKIAQVFIDCAWSVFVCMFKDKDSYYYSFINNPDNNIRDAALKYATNIIDEAKRLNLDIEIISTEPGMGFQEHYIFTNGELVLDKCLDYAEYFLLEESKEKWEQKHECSIPLTAEEYIKRKAISSLYIPNYIELDENSPVYDYDIRPKVNMCKIVKKGGN